MRNDVNQRAAVVDGPCELCDAHWETHEHDSEQYGGPMPLVNLLRRACVLTQARLNHLIDTWTISSGNFARGGQRWGR